MFRLIVVILAAIGLYSLFGGLGFLFLPILFFGLMFAFAGCKMTRRYRGEQRWRGRPADRASREDRFDEWHRMSHARDEVDSWVDDLPAGGQE